jgi:hypothetical protein
MTDVRIIEMSEFDDSMITIDEISSITNMSKLAVQKKIASEKLQAIGMLKSGKRGRPSRLFDRSQVNAIFEISTPLPFKNKEVLSSSDENNQNSSVEQKGVSPPH